LDTNAKIHDVTVFREQVVKSGLRRYVLVKLYIDYVPDAYYQHKPTLEDRRKDGMANMTFEQQQFNTCEEPMYAVLQPKRNGKFEVVGLFREGRITDSARFVGFLRDPRPRRPEDLWREIMNKRRQLGGIP
jgi:hypothetical protein